MAKRPMSGLPNPEKFSGLAGNSSDNNNNNNSGGNFNSTLASIFPEGKRHKSSKKKVGKYANRPFLMGLHVPDNIPLHEVGPPSNEIFRQDYNRSSARKELDEMSSRQKKQYNTGFKRSFHRKISYRDSSPNDSSSNDSIVNRKAVAHGSSRATRLQRQAANTPTNISDYRAKQQQRDQITSRMKRKSDNKNINSTNMKKFNQDRSMGQVDGCFNNNDITTKKRKKKKNSRNNNRYESNNTGNNRYESNNTGNNRYESNNDGNSNNDRHYYSRRLNPPRNVKAKNRIPEVVNLLDDEDDDDENDEKEENDMPSPLKPSKLGPDNNLQFFEYVLFGENLFTPDLITIRFNIRGIYFELRQPKGHSYGSFSFVIEPDDIAGWVYGNEKAQKIATLSRIIQITLKDQTGGVWQTLRNNDTIFQTKLQSFPKRGGINQSIFIIVENEHFGNFARQIESMKFNTDSELGQLIQLRRFWQDIEVFEEEIVEKLSNAIGKYMNNNNYNNNSKPSSSSSTNDGQRRRSSRLRSNNVFDQFNGSSSSRYSSSVSDGTRNKHRRHGRTSGPVQTLFTYPFPPARPRVTITVSILLFCSETFRQTILTKCNFLYVSQDHDLNRCANDFLNDNLIDFSLIRLLDQSFACPETELYAFSSFFYSRFADGKGNYNRALNEPGKIECPDDLGYSYVEKWAKKVDIFKCKYLLIPVNKDIHWSLLIICNPGKIGVQKGTAKEDDEYFCIFHLDSLGCHSKFKVHQIFLGFTSFVKQ
jgi:hypothetical protein